MRAEKRRNEKPTARARDIVSRSFIFRFGYSFLRFSALGFLSGTLSLASAAGRKPEFTTFETTVLHMEHRDVTITPEEAEKIRKALEDYLTQTSDADLEKTIPREFLSALPRRVEAPRVDATGQVRFGPWRLESEGDRIEATCRLPKADQTSAQYLLRYTAPLQENPWKVSSIAFEQISSHKKRIIRLCRNRLLIWSLFSWFCTLSAIAGWRRLLRVRRRVSAQFRGAELEALKARASRRGRDASGMPYFMYESQGSHIVYYMDQDSLSLFNVRLQKQGIQHMSFWSLDWGPAALWQDWLGRRPGAPKAQMSAPRRYHSPLAAA